MSKAYGLLGVLVLVTLVGAYFAYQSATPTVPAKEITEDAMPVTENSTMSFTLSSPAFENNGSIPTKYTCDGGNINPELDISGVPEGTKSLALLMYDPDIPQAVKDSRNIEQFDHWVVYSIPPDTKIIPEGEVVGAQGNNSAGSAAYTGPCPPTQYEPTEHRYIFRLYALSGTLNFIKEPTFNEVEQAAKSMTIDTTELIGRYDRAK